MSLVHRIPRSIMLGCSNVAVVRQTLISQESHLDDAMEGIFHPERQSSIPEHGHGREDKEGQGYFRSASFDMGAYGHPLEDQVCLTLSILINDHFPMILVYHCPITIANTIMDYMFLRNKKRIFLGK